MHISAYEAHSLQTNKQITAKKKQKPRMDLIHVNLWKKSNQTFPELLTAHLTRAEGTTYICHSPIKQLESYKTSHTVIMIFY